MQSKNGGDYERKNSVCCKKCNSYFVKFLGIVKTSEKKIGISMIVKIYYKKFNLKASYLCPKCNHVSYYSLI